MGIEIDCLMISWWESADLPPIMLSMIVAGNIDGMVLFGKEGIRSRIERRWALNCEIVGQASIV